MDDHDRPDLDDAALGALVRDVAGSWQAPPQRLGSPTWRERVASTSRARTGGATAWWRRLAASATAAVAATVGLALVAVWLTTPRASAPGVGAPSPAPTSVAAPTAPGAGQPSVGLSSPSANPSAPAKPRVTPLPTLATFGPGIADRHLMVGVTSNFRVLDLGTGEYSPAIGDRYNGQSELWPIRDGSYLCACMQRSIVIEPGNKAFDTISIALKNISASGEERRSVELPDIRSPRNPSPGPDNAPGLEVSASVGPLGHWLYIGWGGWSADAWHAGIVVIDVAAGKVTQNIALPDVPLDAADSVVVRPIVSPDGATIMALTTAYSVRGGQASRTLLTVSGSGVVRVGSPFTADWAEGAACDSPFEGFLSASLYYALCQDATLHRTSVDGVAEADLFIPKTSGIGLAATGGPRVDPATGRLYLWDPFGHALTVVDGLRGQVLATVTAPAAAAAPAGVEAILRSLGQWLAPSVAAKVYLGPAIQLSPDGSRLYALGVTGTGFEDPGGSAGVFVFDTRALRLVANWPALSDYWSLSLNADGTLLYVAGMPDTGADGRPSDQPASIVAYATWDGEVRAILGALTGMVDLQLNDGQ
jgi:hypothetical protein